MSCSMFSAKKMERIDHNACSITANNNNQNNHHIMNNNNHNNHNSSHHNSQLIVHAGWMMKSPPEKRIWKTKWRRRWFVLKLSGHIPGQYVLEYYVDQTCKKLKGTIDLDQCEQVDAGLQLEIRRENYEFMFDLRTAKRVYYLVTSTEEEMNKWVECICSVCGLKIEAIPNELALLPPMDGLNEERYSPQPIHYGTLQHQQQQQSVTAAAATPPSVSPQPPPPPPTLPPSTTNNLSSSVITAASLAEPSLNYIPISECYTGKPSEDSPPPPRPPKPRALQTAGKSQSSLALWPGVEQVGQQQPLPKKQSSPQLPPHTYNRHHQMSGTLDNAKHRSQKAAAVGMPALYLNHSTNKSSAPSSNVTAMAPAHQYEFCNGNIAGIVMLNQNGNGFEMPPVVNRDLKPQRRHGPGRSSLDNSSSSPFGTQATRHTLPRPPPSYPLRGEDTTRKSFNTNHGHQYNPNLLSHVNTSEKVINKLPPSFMINSLHHQLSNSEMQYLDLDLESSESTNSQSPRTPFVLDPNPSHASSHHHTSHNIASDISSSSGGPNTFHIPPHTNSNNNMSTTHIDPLFSSSLHPHHNNNNNASMPNANLTSSAAIAANNACSNNSSTVYKKVDFVKTKAFNEMRVNVDMYRNGHTD